MIVVYEARLLILSNWYFFFSRYIRLLSAPRLRFSLSFFLSVLGIASSLSSPRLFRISRSEERTSSGLLLPKWRLSWGQRCNYFLFSVYIVKKRGRFEKKVPYIYIILVVLMSLVYPILYP